MHDTMTEDQDQWRALRARYERFSKTEIGRLYYRAYDHATIEYWRHEHVSDKRLKELDQIAREATNAFVAKLMEIAGV